jgi:hypothetical protein
MTAGFTTSEIVCCNICGQRMQSIYDKRIRATCTPCGGVSLSEPIEEARDRLREEAREKQLQLRQQKKEAKNAQAQNPAT